MGLDMYLHKRQKQDKKKLEELDYEDWKYREIAYWRKANQIHKWFVDNVQNGEDDCGEYLVSKEQLEELLDLCNEVLSKAELVDGVIHNGYSYKNGERTEILEDGKIIKNPDICKELLPSTDGFFFGSTDYDEWYLKDIEDTIEQLNYILGNLNFDEYDVIYHSSW